MSFTVISHIYNEEYLLPFWLTYHKNIFTHGIIIDYRSTDKSLDIIREICPTWQIITTRNPCFQADIVDREVMDIENTFSGFKIVLNITEFLVLPKNFVIPQENTCIRMSVYTPLHSTNTYPYNLTDLIQNIQKIDYSTFRYFRTMHNYNNGNYELGRHSTRHNFTQANSDIYVLWFGFYPWNDEIIKRKLQIKNNIPDSDRYSGRGTQHFLSTNDLVNQKNNLFNGASDASSAVNTILDAINYRNIV